MFKRINGILVFVAIVLASTISFANQCKITILHFNDFHGAIGSAARLASVVGKIDKKNLKEGRHTLLFFGGDLISGTPISHKYKGEVEYKFLNAIGTEAMVVGNHEFDFGVDTFRKRMKEANFPILSANIVDKKNERLLTTTATYTFPLGKGCRLGVMGLTSKDTPEMTDADVSSLQFSDPIKAASDYIDDFVDQHEVKVALTHMGVDQDIKLAKKVKSIDHKGFDVVIGGHDHVDTDDHCRVAKGVTVCQTPANGKYVGRIDLTVNNGRVTVEKTELIPVKGGQSKDVKNLLKPYIASVDSTMNEVVGSLNSSLPYRTDDGSEAPLGKFLARLMVKNTGADVGFVNLGGIRKSLNKGSVTRGDIFEAFPFENLVGSLTLSGGDIVQLIKLSGRLTRGGHYQPRLCWYGVTYQKLGNGSYKVLINGKQLDNNERYKVATINFLAEGNDGYTFLKNYKFTSTGKLYREIVADYLISQR